MERLSGARRRRPPVGLLGVAFVTALTLAVAAPATAQLDRAGLAAACETAGGASGDCLRAALGAEAIAGGVGLAFSLGDEFPGSASTLGKRFGTTPRVAAAVRFGMSGLELPEGPSGVDETTSAWVPSLHGAVAVSLFDGFRPRPTVGGVLAVDLIATGDFAFLPSGDGFDGAVAAIGYGIRLGAVRESFSLPGITVSALRRHGGRLEWAGVSGDRPGAVVLDGTTTTSLRGTVGREFLALGIQAGLGWERISADGTLGPAGPAASSGAVVFEDLEADRILFFGGVTWTWLVTQLHAELGYASGFESTSDPAAGAFDPTAGALLGSLTFRILF
ncbi:MAG: hypothetical protein KJO11_09740 [Gemmatimonadetes bacterium]|nr:hypothetical protein [Gemmatimonadota bacterium]